MNKNYSLLFFFFFNFRFLSILEFNIRNMKRQLKQNFFFSLIMNIRVYDFVSKYFFFSRKIRLFLFHFFTYCIILVYRTLPSIVCMYKRKKCFLFVLFISLVWVNVFRRTISTTRRRESGHFFTCLPTFAHSLSIFTEQ